MFLFQPTNYAQLNNFMLLPPLPANPTDNFSLPCQSTDLTEEIARRSFSKRSEKDRSPGLSSLKKTCQPRLPLSKKIKKPVKGQPIKKCRSCLTIKASQWPRNNTVSDLCSACTLYRRRRKVVFLEKPKECRLCSIMKTSLWHKTGHGNEYLCNNCALQSLGKPKN